MSIKTEYQGYTITYSENADEWNCYDCGVSHPSLSKVKAKIDLLHRRMRRKAAVHCYLLGHSDAEVKSALLVEYIGPQYSTGRWPETKKSLTGHKVAAMYARWNNERASRSEHDLTTFAPKTPDVDAAIAIWRAAVQQKKAFEEAARKAFDAIPRLQLSDIEALVKASEQKIEEDSLALQATQEKG